MLRNYILILGANRKLYKEGIKVILGICWKLYWECIGSITSIEKDRFLSFLPESDIRPHNSTDLLTNQLDDIYTQKILILCSKIPF